jgi:hypothetical protein
MFAFGFFFSFFKMYLGPYPFLIGVHASHLPDILDPDSDLALSEVIVVDLDSSEIHVAGSGKSGANPVIRDMVESDQSARVMRRGADTLDGFRVKASRFIASRLERITSVDVSSSIETYNDKTSDAAATLLERLSSIVATNEGKTAAWRLANMDDASESCARDDPELVPWVEPGSGDSFETVSKTSSSSSSSLAGIGPDDMALSEALLVFFLQLVGDPRPFANVDDWALGVPPSIDKVRERYLSSRQAVGSTPGSGDSAALTGFLGEFVHTQQFQVFSMLRDVSGRTKNTEDDPFFLSASLIGKLGNQFDKVCFHNVKPSTLSFTNAAESSASHHCTEINQEGGRKAAAWRGCCECPALPPDRAAAHLKLAFRRGF